MIKVDKIRSNALGFLTHLNDVPISRAQPLATEMYAIENLEWKKAIVICVPHWCFTQLSYGSVLLSQNKRYLRFRQALIRSSRRSCIAYTKYSYPIPFCSLFPTKDLRTKISSHSHAHARFAYRTSTIRQLGRCVEKAQNRIKLKGDKNMLTHNIMAINVVSLTERLNCNIQLWERYRSNNSNL